MTISNNILKNSIIGFSVLLLMAITLVLIIKWFQHDVAKVVAPVDVHVIATPAKQIESIPKHQAVVKSGTVRVYESRAKIELKLPEAIKQDNAKQVLESTRVSSDDHDQTITTVLNTETGDTETLVRREPLPWLAFRSDGSAAAYIGVKNGDPTTRIEVKQSIFSIKDIKIGAVATVDLPLNDTITSSNDAFIGIGAEYHW